MMSIQDQLVKVAPELLQKAFEFAAHALNDTKVISGACKEAGIPKAEGYALAQFFTELGINESCSITNMAELAQATNEIKASMPHLS